MVGSKRFSLESHGVEKLVGLKFPGSVLSLRLQWTFSTDWESCRDLIKTLRRIIDFWGRCLRAMFEMLSRSAVSRFFKNLIIVKNWVGVKEDGYFGKESEIAVFIRRIDALTCEYRSEIKFASKVEVLGSEDLINA